MNNNDNLRSRISHEIKNLSPAYFALVMATGIISVAAFLLDFYIISVILFWLNIIHYLVLFIFFIVRIIIYQKELIQDLLDHTRSTGFFTFVAATCVLGGQFIVIYNNYFIATILWIIGLIFWIILMYSVFTILTVKEDKPPLDKGITGGWLLSVVATQSISVLSALISTQLEQPFRLQMNFLALSMWLWGGMLYIWMISLIFYRYTFFKFLPGDLSPPYWINMGAMAISTLAGAVLIRDTSDAPFLMSVLPFLKGFTIFYWATGTWWIPMLFILAIWRHVHKRFPLIYDPHYWGAVFPIGMYTVCTYQIAQSMNLTFLFFIPRYFIYLAFIVWIMAFSGLIRRIYKVLRG